MSTHLDAANPPQVPWDGMPNARAPRGIASSRQRAAREVRESRQESLPRGLYLYIAAVVVAAFVAAAAIVSTLDRPADANQAWLAPVLLLVVVVLAHFPLRLAPRHQQELYPAAGLAALALLGPAAAIGICVSGQLLSEMRQRHSRPAQWLFNSAVVALQAGVAAVMVAAARVERLPATNQLGLAEVLAAGAAWFVVGAILVECAVALQSRRPPWTHWWERQRTATFVEATLLVVGAFGALIIDIHPWSLPLLAIPVVAIYQAFASQQLDLAAARYGRERAEHARRRLTALVDATPDLVLTLDASSVITYANPAARATLGLQDSVGSNTRPIDELFPNWKRIAIAAAESGSWSGESEFVTPEGRRPVSQVVLVHRSPRGEIEFISTIARDIGERKSLEEALAQLADHDVLTGVFNRRRFDAELDAALADPRLRSTGGALLYIDLDGFKEVNDTLGHSAGDRLLQEIASSLEQTVSGARGIVGRLGGDEFALLVPRLDARGISQFAERVLAAVKGCSLSAENLHVGASIGIAMLSDGHATRDQLVAAADGAMYEAKRSGGGSRFADHPGDRRLTA